MWLTQPPQWCHARRYEWVEGWPAVTGGAPRELWLVWSFPNATSGLAGLDVMWVDKTTTRLPEALWVQFR